MSFSGVASRNCSARSRAAVAGTTAGTRRERLDVSLFLRRLLGVRGFRFCGLLPRRRLSLPKAYVAHGAVLLIVAVVVAANVLTTSADRGSLLFALFGEAEIEEGPLAASQATRGSSRGPFLGLISPAVAGGISEDDLEFELANTLGGNALIATASPETAEASTTRRSGIVAHTVHEGDTPASIAARFGISTPSVLWANGISDEDLIHPGDVLVIPPGSGVLHKVVAGDDVTSLALAYDAKVEDIIARNGLDESGAIRVGQRLFVPDGRIPSVPRRIAVREEEPAAPTEPPVTAPQPGPGLLWPTAARHISQYFRWGHTGVDISTNGSRPPVVASQDGQVNFAGWLGGYGRLIIVDHGSGRRTYYAHLSEAHVKPGQTVARGQAIGRVGCTGRCSGNHVHWEYRINERAVNPLGYLR